MSCSQFFSKRNYSHAVILPDYEEEDSKYPDE
jgi:hypothetical protein